VTLARIIASGLGSGRAPRAPGTVASLLAVLLGIPLMLAPSGTLALATAVASLGGLWAIHAAKVDGDPGWVVIDEIAGQWLALLGLARPTALGLLAAFALFRLFDIAKPGPVGWADRQAGATGIMWALRTYWPVLFS